MVTLGSIPIYIIILYSCLFYIQAQEIEISQCSTTASYTPNSPFLTNLNSLLSSFVANGPRDGFFNNTVGASPDTVYGLVSCRGDLSMNDCQMCLNNATANITQLCPNAREATLRYQNCLVRYSNGPFFNQGNNTPIAYYSSINVTAADAPRYRQQLEDLMMNLSNTAMTIQSRYASGSAAYSDVGNIYGLAQCTRDLSPSTCSSCLQSMYRYIPICCGIRIGARIFSPTCNIRYEITPFIQATAEPPRSTSPSQAPTLSTYPSETPPPGTSQSELPPPGTSPSVPPLSTSPPPGTSIGLKTVIGVPIGVGGLLLSLLVT